MLGEYCELPEFYDESEPRARKQYKCVECKAPIEVGEKHLSYRGNWPACNGFDHGRQHLVCRDICVQIKVDFNGGDCIGFGDMHESFRDTMNNMYRREWDDKVRKLRGRMAQVKRRERLALRTSEVSRSDE